METLLTDHFNFSLWWHYALLLLWILILFAGIKFYNKIESLFEKKDKGYDGNRSGKSMLILSFVTGLIMVVVWMFKPAELDQASTLQWNYIELAFYGLIVILILLNLIISLMSYKLNSGILRIIILTTLMLIYFYTGMFGGLLILSVFAIVVVLYFLLKFVNILKIK